VEPAVVAVAGLGGETGADEHEKRSDDQRNLLLREEDEMALHPDKLHPDHESEGEVELRHQFDSDLDEIRQGIVDMGSVVVDNVRRAGEAVTENRLDLVEEVRNTDLEVNAMYRDLSTQTFRILALQQPVAGDLRFLVAATRILYEIERSGDLAVNMVNRLAARHGFPHVANIPAILARLVDESATMFSMAIDAVADMDAEVGRRAEKSDDVVDQLTERFFGTTHARSAELGLDAAVELTHIGRFLERIADHGVNIAQNVAFVVDGTFPDDDPVPLKHGD
jgi:phosphate transport system protein